VNRDSLLASLSIDLDPEARVLDLDADEPTLDDVPDASIDGATRLTRRGPKAALGELAELGRVLRPGGWAVVRISTAPADAPPEPPKPASRRDLLRGLGGRVREPAPGPRPVPLEALGAVAVESGLDIERIDGSGTSDTVVLVRASRDAGSIRASRPG
jgi:hypothetical protein